MSEAATPRWGRRHAVLAMCFLAMFIAYTDRVNISVASVAMREQFGWTQTVKGLVLSSFFVGYMLFMVVSGWLATRYGGKRVLAISVAWWSAFTVLTPWAASLRKARRDRNHYPDHADPQAFEVFGPTDRALRVRQLAEAVFPPGDRDDALLLDDLKQALARLGK